MNAEKKRKNDASDDNKRAKRSKTAGSTDLSSVAKSNQQVQYTAAAKSSSVPATIAQTSHLSDIVEQDANGKEKGKETTTAEVRDTTSAPSKRRPKIRKLTPARPFPTVPTSVSATGPRSAHKEGKNYICVTRRTSLGAYLRRCKDCVLKDGYKTLHLSAMGAAIPHLAMLSVSLPRILPYSAEEIHTEVLTGTVEVQDEVIPDDEDEDISYRSRSKSSLRVVIRIGDGNDESQQTKKGQHKHKGKGKSSKRNAAEQLVLQEPEQVDMDDT